MSMQFYTEFINRKTTCETWVTAFKGIIDNLNLKPHMLNTSPYLTLCRYDYEFLFNMQISLL